MDRMLYVAMSAAQQMMNAQALSSHNLANVATVGFKADFEAARAMPVYGPGLPTRAYAMLERPGTNFAPGTVESTANDLDIAVNGNGFIAVQAADGSEAYTRAGDLQIDVNGQLHTGAGHPVLGNGGPIAIPQAEALVIGVDGTISVRPLGQAASTLAQVDRIKLVNPAVGQLLKGADGLMRLRDGTNAPPDAAVQVTRGALEHSNVNGVAEMVQLISNSRQYDMAIKAMSTAQQIDSAGAKLLDLNA